ncbi:unnamed protein product [Paramecium sonneborni]|uniref:TLDc domain-containing protein n=1 Tax=Paramecium sonneborni TaxID=65129 RepID=A0A8S1RER5_9CILI|nr:unnamed protein product [Paramecium sonneborni]
MLQLPCFQHDRSLKKYILIGKKETKLLCDSCLTELTQADYKFDPEELIHVNNAYRTPETLLKILKISKDILNFVLLQPNYDEFQLNHQIKILEKRVEEINLFLQGMIKELKSKVKFILELKQNISDEIENEFQFNNFKSIIENLQELKDTLTDQNLNQNQQSLNKYFKTFLEKDVEKLNQKLYQILEKKRVEFEKQEQFQKLQEYFNNITDKHNQLIQQIQPNFPNVVINYRQNIELYKQKIFEIIVQRSEKKLKSTELIYQGSRDGLSSDQFWYYIKGRSNLLMIFLSKSGCVFGGYSPCLWSPTFTGKYVQDDLLSSFLFSQTHDQIYPIKYNQRDKAIYCKYDCGPCFGGGYDIKISSDFQDGSCYHLGNTYKCEQYLMNKKTHLFGQCKPQIIECEIFQINLL